MSLKFFGAKNKKDFLKKLLTILFITIFFVILIWLWQYYVESQNIPKRILPKPTDISNYAGKEFFGDHRKGYNTLIEKSMDSFFDALVGFTISAILGTTIGVIFAKSELMKLSLTPPFFMLQLLPVPAFAPVVAAILGYGLTTKILIIVLFTIYAFMLAAYDAVTHIPKNHTALFLNYNASRLKTYKDLILPALVPNLLHTMKIASTASIVASIIAELPLTVSKGIGKDIFVSFNNQLIPRVWLSLIIISIISLMFFGLVSYLDKYINSKYKYGEF